MINVLYLTGSFFMLEVYDRVLPSRSVPTLVGLSVLALGLYGFQGVLDLLRGRVLVRIGRSLDESLSARVYQTIARLALATRSAGDGLQPLRDLDQVRSFLSGSGPLALFDLPWMPLYLGICFVFHVWIGVAATVGAVVLIAITLSDRDATPASRPATAVGLAARRNALAEAAGATPKCCTPWAWRPQLAGALGRGQRASTWTPAARQRRRRRLRRRPRRCCRMVLQSAVLGVGAYLVIDQRGDRRHHHRELDPDGARAGAGRAGDRQLEGLRRRPAELAAARRAAAAVPDQGRGRWRCPPPRSASAVERQRGAAGRQTVSSCRMSPSRSKPGNGLGIIGPSASGKSSLARALVGVWPPARGTIRLDGATLDQWAPEALGRHIGYLPQDVELFDGTVAREHRPLRADAGRRTRSSRPRRRPACTS